jgi:hypothetical protein
MVKHNPSGMVTPLYEWHIEDEANLEIDAASRPYPSGLPPAVRLAPLGWRSRRRLAEVVLGGLLGGAVAGVEAVGILENFVHPFGVALLARGIFVAGGPLRPSTTFHWFRCFNISASFGLPVCYDFVNPAHGSGAIESKLDAARGTNGGWEANRGSIILVR